MEIYKSYGIEDILFDLPCRIDDTLSVYPVKVADYKRFNQLSKYLLISKENLGISSDIDLLTTVIQIALQQMSEGREDILEECFYTIVGELEELFSILTRDNIIFKSNTLEKMIFTNENHTNIISSYNYENLRKVVIKQNLIHEQKVYKNKIVAEWADRVRRAREKNNPKTNFYDILNIVSVGMNLSYKEIYESMNVFQLYSYFARLAHEENYRATILFKTVSDKVPNVDYSKSMITEIMKNPDDDLFKDSGNSKLGNMLN